MIHPDPYPSKIMLAGEYGVVVGGSALTIPYYRFDAKVREIGDTTAGETREAEISQKYLLMLFNYIAGLQPEAIPCQTRPGLFLCQPEKLLAGDEYPHRVWTGEFGSSQRSGL